MGSDNSILECPIADIGTPRTMIGASLSYILDNLIKLNNPVRHIK